MKRMTAMWRAGACAALLSVLACNFQPAGRAPSPGVTPNAGDWEYSSCPMTRVLRRVSAVGLSRCRGEITYISLEGDGSIHLAIASWTSDAYPQFVQLAYQFATDGRTLPLNCVAQGAPRPVEGVERHFVCRPQHSGPILHYPYGPAWQKARVDEITLGMSCGSQATFKTTTEYPADCSALPGNGTLLDSSTSLEFPDIWLDPDDRM